MGLTRHLFTGIVVGALGGFQHGYHTAIPNNPQKIITEWMGSTLGNRTGSRPDHDTETLMWAMGAIGTYCIGGMVGGLLTAPIVKTLGRKLSLLIQNVITISLSVVLFSLCKLFKSFEMFMAGRFLVGINNGLNSGIGPMYLSEISPTSMRGGISTVYQLMITIAILFGQVVSLGEVFGTAKLWNWMLFSIIPGVICLFQVLLFLLVKDTPRGLLERKTEEEAKKALVWFRQSEDVDAEFTEMKTEHDHIQAAPKVHFSDYFTKKKLRTPLIISNVIMLSQQFSGINAVIFYSTSIIEKAGFSMTIATYCTVIIGFFNVLATILSVWLVERFGRKIILLISFGGMAVTTSLIFVGMLLQSVASLFLYMTFVNIVLYVVIFAIGAGPIPWFLVAELFNQDARPIATAIAVATNWLANTIVSTAFPNLMILMGPYVFVIFIGLQVLFFVFILFMVPETKNKPIEEIVQSFE